MIDFFCIFTTGGVVLWYKAFLGELKFDLVNLFIRNILLQDKAQKQSYNFSEFCIKWTIETELNLVFAVRPLLRTYFFLGGLQGTPAAQLHGRTALDREEQLRGQDLPPDCQKR
jgi:hypothetical protein